MNFNVMYIDSGRAQRASGATYEEIAAAGGGIRATVRATAAGTLEDLVAAGRERALRMLAVRATPSRTCRSIRCKARAPQREALEEPYAPS